MARFSFFVHDLSLNPIGRAYPIAQALQEAGHEVEILGFLIKGPSIYAPYKTAFKYKTMPSSGRMHQLLRDATKLAALATGEWVYAFKPLWTSYWPALLATHFGKRKPLLLDVEDHELYAEHDHVNDFIYHHILRGWNSHEAWKIRWALHPLTRFASATTVVSTILQQRYGGTQLLHGPSENLFDPNRPDCEPSTCKSEFSLPTNRKLVLFCGSPHKRKGLHILTAALASPKASAYDLIGVGDPTFPAYQEAKEVLGDRFHFIPYLPNKELPHLLAAADVVVIPQLKDAFASCQIPAKLLEAMAMGKAIIVSQIGDLPLLISEPQESAQRGWVVPSGDVSSLANQLQQLETKPEEIQAKGRAATDWFRENASHQAIRDTLRPILSNLAISFSLETPQL